jgi:TonB family protein
MTGADQTFRRNLFVVSALHAAVIGSVVMLEGVAWSARNNPALVELFTPADILGDLPQGPGHGRGNHAPPAESGPPSEATFTPEEKPVTKAKPVAKAADDAGAVKIPSKKPVKPVATAAKPVTSAQKTGAKTAAADANSIRQRFQKALQAGGGSGSGTPYGDGKPAGGGSGKSAVIGSPDGSPDGVVGGVGKGSPFWSYYQHVHDRMYEAWEQPGQALNWDKGLMATVMIRVARDGRIVDVSLRNSSGNRLLDDSALTAARRVRKLEPLPEGLGGEFANISVNFQLEG